jgi:hydrogenase maturation protein HypF
MLPTTPLHPLLLEDDAGALVMTSGNRAEEPIAKDDTEAFAKLDEVADAFLVHDRHIHTRADDSVVRVAAGTSTPIRLARGFVPTAVPLGFDAPPVLAVGGQLKNTVCLTRGGDAFVSQHVGDLDHPDAAAFFDEVIAKMQRLLGAEPLLVAHDLHPDYASTRWAMDRKVTRLGVQHHHAHVAACLTEHGRVEDAVLGVAFDGTGCGPAGDLWGGEFLLASLRGFERLGHLRPIALAGGEAAIKEVWRLGIAARVDAGEPIDVVHGVAPAKLAAVEKLIARSRLSPRATGCGRWFDAASAILGVRSAVSYEAQAAVELEVLALTAKDPLAAPPYPFTIERAAPAPFVVDLRPTIRALAKDTRLGVPHKEIAARFHATLAETILVACKEAHGARSNVPRTIALTGGSFQNRLLTEGAVARLEKEGFEVLVHRRVPPNDGGLALGQVAIAAYRLARNQTKGE